MDLSVIRYYGPELKIPLLMCVASDYISLRVKVSAHNKSKRMPIVINLCY